MKYKNGEAFRQALEQRLKSQSRKGIALSWLRKMVVFERLLARLEDGWVLKGGYALQARSHKVRTTKDIDLLTHLPIEIAQKTLQESALKEIGDHFNFNVSRSREISDDINSVRFNVDARLDGRKFENFHVDIGFEDIVIEPVEKLYLPFYLEFAGLRETKFPCYPLSQHLAEKIHAITLPRKMDSSRVKDLVDVLIIGGMAGGIEIKILSKALNATFQTRGTHELPSELPSPPDSWKRSFSRMAKDIELSIKNLDEAFIASSKFINPLLSGDRKARWDSGKWMWK